MRVGLPVQGVLTEDIWVHDCLLLPAGTPVHGQVAALEPAERRDRLKAMLGGDFTPLHTPVVEFETAGLPHHELSFRAEGRVQQSEMVRFVATPHRSLPARLISMLKDDVHKQYATVAGPEKKDRAIQLLYNQLPYHPQRIWAGTEFVADLAETTPVPTPPEPSPEQVSDADLAGSFPSNAIVKARLLAQLSSDSSKRGEPVSAMVTMPVYDAQRRILLAQGATLEGSVQQARPSRSLGRNGVLRFSFREVRRTEEARPQALYGNLVGAGESKRENLKVDEEGTVKASPDNNRFTAPLLLGILAAHGEDDDGGAGAQVAAANGLGLVARVLAWTVASRNLATGFGVYGTAKSVYFRFLAKGHAVTFPVDTPIEVQMSSR